MNQIKYKIVYTQTYRTSYGTELRYSKKNFGKIHADVYFTKVREMIKGLAHNPKLYIKRGKFRIATGIEGIQVLYSINEKDKIVEVLDIAGKHRYHELKNKNKT